MRLSGRHTWSAAFTQLSGTIDFTNHERSPVQVKLHRLAPISADLSCGSAFCNPGPTALHAQRRSRLSSPPVYADVGPDVLLYAVDGTGAASRRHRIGQWRLNLSIDDAAPHTRAARPHATTVVPSPTSAAS